MNRNDLYLSTIAPDAAAVAREYGLGLEIAEYCTAWNMDEKRRETEERVRRQIQGCAALILHAPFNELFPCAIDPKARALAAERYRQAAELARGHGAKKLVIHGGYHPYIYYEPWYVEQSILFWKEFLREDPGVQIVLENVLEPKPEMLLDIVRGVADPRLRLCLDIGHVNAYSRISVMQWLERLAPWLSHFHIHNNDGSWDTHSPLDQGNISVKEFLARAQELCADASFTLELTECRPSVRWLLEG